MFHDDQHGTAIVVLAALTNALRCVSKPLDEPRRRGRRRRGRYRDRRAAAGGRRRHVLVWDREGILARDDALSTGQARLAAATNPACEHGDLHDALRGADVFIGVSPPTSCRRSGSPTWPATRSSSRWPTPTPRSTSTPPGSSLTILATGRTDYPNQINNVLAFPGVFRGLLDARAHEVTPRCCCRPPTRWPTASATSSSTPSYIVPSVFDPEVPKAVAAAVRAAATEGANDGKS